jgi:TonB family protein
MLQIDREIFASRQSRRGWNLSLLLHGIVVVVLLTLTLPAPVAPKYRATPLYLPVTKVAVVNFPKPRTSAVARPQALPISQAMPPIPYANATPVLVAAAEIPQLHMPPVAPALPTSALPAIVLPEAAAPRRVEVHTGSFEGPSSSAAPPAVKIQTGAFDSAANLAAKTSRASASSASFGDSVFAQPARPEANRISSTQFDTVAAAATPRHGAANPSAYAPIEILAKPKPVYTDEARRLRIQGEVVLEVLFRASSQVYVLRVVRGLGHGLDDSAQRAALGIRFHPAAEGGRAVDSVATVKIEFQLAD